MVDVTFMEPNFQVIALIWPLSWNIEETAPFLTYDDNA